MKKIILVIITIFIGLISCSDKKNKTELSENLNDTISKKEIYDRFWIEYLYPNNISEKIEVYISSKNDTIVNQYKYLNNGIIDSTKSDFYKLKLIESNEFGVYKGIIKYYPQIDKKLKSKVSEKTLFLGIRQKSKDSTYFEVFKSKDTNEIKFKLVNYENNNIEGVLYEVRVLDTIINDKEMARIIETRLAVDNKEKTGNICIELYELNKR